MEDIDQINTKDSYSEREGLWDEQWPAPSGGNVAGHLIEETDILDEELPFPDTVGTTDPIVSVRDAEPYIPPIDPPVLPSRDQGIRMATGFGESTEEGLEREGLSRGDEDIRDDALRALQDDSDMSTMPLDVDIKQGVVHLRGVVQSIDDADRAANLISYVHGVVDVVDDTTLDTA